jgi:predicted dienelactone hydrolase
MRHFASHGWIAVAPDHVGNTLTDTPATLPIDGNYLRSMDVSATLDALDALPMEDPLRGRASTRRAVLSGHSFGTHTVWSSLGATYDVAAIRARCLPMGQCTEADLAVFQAGLGDARFIAGIPMAGAIRREWFGAEGHRSVRVPMFSMSGTDDRVGADTQFMTATGIDLTWIEVRGGCHQYFALGSCANIPDSEQTPILGTYALAFARKHLLNDADPGTEAILSGTRMVSDRVAFQRRTP